MRSINTKTILRTSEENRTCYDNSSPNRKNGRKPVNAKKLANGLLGLAAGIVTAPLAVIIWPLFAAWFLYNETED